MSDEYPHGDDRVFFDDHAFDDFGSGADEAVVFNDGGIGLKGLEDSTDSDSSAEVDVFSDLGAGANSGPCIDHCAFIDKGAKVDITWHENYVFGDIASAADDGRGDDAKAGILEILFGVVLKLEGYFIEESERAGFDGGVIVESEA